MGRGKSCRDSLLMHLKNSKHSSFEDQHSFQCQRNDKIHYPFHVCSLPSHSAEGYVLIAVYLFIYLYVCVCVLFA